MLLTINDEVIKVDKSTSQQVNKSTINYLLLTVNFKLFIVNCSLLIGTVFLSLSLKMMMLIYFRNKYFCKR